MEAVNRDRGRDSVSWFITYWRINVHRKCFAGAVSWKTALLFLCLSLRRFGEKFRIEDGIEFNLFDFCAAGFVAILLILMFVGHGDTVGGAPVGKIAFTLKGTALSHGFIFFAQNVTRL